MNIPFSESQSRVQLFTFTLSPRKLAVPNSRNSQIRGQRSCYVFSSKLADLGFRELDFLRKELERARTSKKL